MLRERGFSDEFIRDLQNSTACSSRASEYCLIRLLRKQCVNVVPIRDRMLEIIGYGIFPTLSPIQRSCDPNCVVVFDNLCAKLIAIRPILPKDHLTVRDGKVIKYRFLLFQHDIHTQFVMSIDCY